MGNGQNNSQLFSGMEHLGFNDTNSFKIYNSADEDEAEAKEAPAKETSEDKEKKLLYDKEVYCPVCGSKFNARSVKVSAARMIKKDSDFLIRYSNINPYFYDVWLCISCGYASMKKDFEYIKEHQTDGIKKNITLRWRGKDYPEVYDIDIAIERYKLSLLNYCVINAKNSSKAMNCLKIAWMYRLKDDVDTEQIFLKQALEGFEAAFYGEAFPIYGMDRYTTMYLIAELNRRLGDLEKAMLWFSKVITTPSVSPKLKEMARDQKDLIKESVQESNSETAEVNDTNNKKGFLKSLFKGK